MLQMFKLPQILLPYFIHSTAAIIHKCIFNSHECFLTHLSILSSIHIHWAKYLLSLVEHIVFFHLPQKEPLKSHRLQMKKLAHPLLPKKTTDLTLICQDSFTMDHITLLKQVNRDCSSFRDKVISQTPGVSNHLSLLKNKSHVSNPHYRRPMLQSAAV